MIDFLFKTSGDKTNRAIIFLHGFLGNASDWHAIIRPLSATYYCLALDLPGHGKSKFPDKNLSLAKCAEALNQFLQKHNLVKPVLLGYSMGGRIALHMILQQRLFWHGAIIESASPGLEQEDERQKRLQQDVKLAGELEQKSMAAFLDDWYEQAVFAGLRESNNYQSLYHTRLNNDTLQLARVLRNWSVGRQESLWPRLRSISLPLLYIAGVQDEKYAAIARKMSEQSEHITVQIIANSGHIPHFENAQAFIDCIKAYLQRLPG